MLVALIWRDKANQVIPGAVKGKTVKSARMITGKETSGARMDFGGGGDAEAAAGFCLRQSSPSKGEGFYWTASSLIAVGLNMVKQEECPIRNGLLSNPCSSTYMKRSWSRLSRGQLLFITFITPPFSSQPPSAYDFGLLSRLSIWNCFTRARLDQSW